jgi:hypothetical protein
MNENQDLPKENKQQKIILPHNPYARATPLDPVVRVLPKIGRNTRCPLENKKFKNCCGASGQDFCTKAKENLENYVNELREKHNDKSS